MLIQNAHKIDTKMVVVDIDQRVTFSDGALRSSDLALAHRKISIELRTASEAPQGTSHHNAKVRRQHKFAPKFKCCSILSLHLNLNTAASKFAPKFKYCSILSLHLN